MGRPLKKFEIDERNGIRVDYGTPDPNRVMAAHIRFSTFMEIDKYDSTRTREFYARKIERLRQKIKYRIHNLNSNLFNKTSIVAYDLKESGLDPKHRSFFEIEAILFSLKPFSIANNDEFHNVIKDIAIQVIDNDFPYEFFTFQANK